MGSPVVTSFPVRDDGGKVVAIGQVTTVWRGKQKKVEQAKADGAVQYRDPVTLKPVVQCKAHPGTFAEEFAMAFPCGCPGVHCL